MRHQFLELNRIPSGRGETEIAEVQSFGKPDNGWHHWGAASNVDFKFGTDGNSDGCFC
jgi:hypothetical protein